MAAAWENNSDSDSESSSRSDKEEANLAFMENTYDKPSVVVRRLFRNASLVGYPRFFVSQARVFVVLGVLSRYLCCTVEVCVVFLDTLTPEFELYVRLRERRQWGSNCGAIGFVVASPIAWCVVSNVVRTPKHHGYLNTLHPNPRDEFRTCWGRVEEFLVAGEQEIVHTKPFFFPFSSAATCTNHPLEVDQRQELCVNALDAEILRTGVVGDTPLEETVESDSERGE
ncbi:hypothetical protein Taro_021806 [Colocasia esculenta]|uniref:Uncharacterized protein n=1 Tax=Colocasia esculenta TaxID=4460 RepID=A0A843V282_COLES|nr:hypothetical protein [Colocasia esculenta]